MQHWLCALLATSHPATPQVRMLFLLHKYNDPMDYGDNTMTGALSVERTFVEFFHSIKNVARSVSRLGMLAPLDSVHCALIHAAAAPHAFAHTIHSIAYMMHTRTHLCNTCTRTRTGERRRQSAAA
jgi:cysteinyl-tRNA synthetase